ncbi:hypothetical protein [Qipengyuania sp. JC766]|uniref:hypothetical protein n=1 Tax=Qipengyuania sp. JC766 TaxID=3232139 RepID=UPI00345823A9
MRAIALAITASLLMLGACDNAAEQQDADDLPGTPKMATDAPGSIRLTGPEITVMGPMGATLGNNAPRDQVEAELAKSLGPVAERGRNEECGAGPVESSRFDGGLTINFQDGRMAGWVLEQGDADIATKDGGITVGSSFAELDAAYTVELVDSTLGDEFTTGEGINGFLTGEGDARTVESLYAGTTCFFR